MKTNKTEEEKKRDFDEFKNRFEARIKEIESQGFSREQAEWLAAEFAKLLSV